MNITLDDPTDPRAATFHLPNGDRIQVSFGRCLSVEGYHLEIHHSWGSCSKLLVTPQASNALTLTTPAAMAEEEKLVKEVVRRRNSVELRAGIERRYRKTPE